MSERELRTMFDHASAFCDKAMASRGEIAPLWHAITSSGETIIEPHPTWLGKDMAAAAIRAMFELCDVVRYIYIGEAWTLIRMMRPEEEEEIFRKGLSEHPDRVEVVQIQGEDRACGQMMGARKIIRPKKGKPYLGPVEMIEDLPYIPRGATMRSEGRMVGMLPVRGVRQ